MTICDHELRQIGEDMIRPFDSDNIYSIGYDLTTRRYVREPGKYADRIVLTPGESIFVEAKEHIALPADICARVVLRNSRIRQGLLLTAPVYQPGHHTPVFFRVTNISSQSIALDTVNGIASIMFERLDGAVDEPYSGAFVDETAFVGLGEYKEKLGHDTVDLEERKIVRHNKQVGYENTLGIIALVVAVISILNMSISMISREDSLKMVLAMDLSIIGSVSAILGIVRHASFQGKAKESSVLWIVAIVAFAVAVLALLVLP